MKTVVLAGLVLMSIAGCSAEGSELSEPARDTGAGGFGELDTATIDSAVVDSALTPDTAVTPTADTFETAVADTAKPPTTLDLHEATLFDNPKDLADWPETTKITAVAFQTGSTEGLHVEFSKREGPGSWPDITPPGWDGPLEYTVGLAEYIDGKWYASAAIQYWRGLDASGGNVAMDVVSKAQCTAFGYGSSCQVAKNWYYDGRWGKLAGRQPKTGELIGVFVVAGNVRGVIDGSQSPVRERSNVVLVPMPDVAGAKYTF